MGTGFKRSLRAPGHRRLVPNELAFRIGDPVYEAWIMVQHGDQVAPGGIVAMLIPTKRGPADAELTAILTAASS